MKKIISIPVYFLFIVLSSVFIFSCGEDNPVSTPPPDVPYQYDSARFDWKVDTLQGYFSPQRLSCIDTNDIYFLDLYRTLVHYDGENFETQFLPFSVLGLSIKAYEDKVYIGGYYLSTSKYGKPALLVKEGNMFSVVEIPDSNQVYSINSIERTANDEVWLGSDNGKLLKYKAGSFQFFQFDTIYYVDVFKDQNGNIFSINTRELYDSIGNNGRKYLEINKYENGSFRRLYYKYFEQIDNYTLMTNIINGEIYAKNFFNILKFEGSEFSNIIDIPGFASSFGFSGNSSTDILIKGYFLPNPHYSNLFHWNGKKWSNELQFYSNVFFELSAKVRDNYIFLGVNDPREIYLFMSSPKKHF